MYDAVQQVRAFSIRAAPLTAVAWFLDLGGVFDDGESRPYCSQWSADTFFFRTCQRDRSGV